MKPEAQRIAIAEACGWTAVRPHNDWHYGLQPGNHGLGDRPAARLPDYLSDLNAMHEAEKYMEGRDFTFAKRYSIQLNQLCTGIGQEWEAIFATAAQRAEAFLRTLNLWTE